MQETWVDICGYEGKYQVSNFGNVKALSYNRTGIEKLLKHRINKGYHYVALYDRGTATNYLVHRIVALHFIDNPTQYEEVNHIDGNKDNNRVDNLEWTTPKQNCVHSVMTKLRILPTFKILQFTISKKLIREWNSVYEIVQEYGYDSSMIYKCCEGKLNHAYGFVWEYGSRDTESNIYVRGDYHKQLS